MEKMKEIPECEAKDKILRYLLNKDWETCESVKRNLLTDWELDMIFLMITKIAEFRQNVIEIREDKFGHRDIRFRKGVAAERFINQYGGFERVDRDEKAKLKKQADIAELELEKLRYDTKLSKWQVKTFWYIFFGGFIGGLMGATSLILELEGRGYITLPIELRQSRPEQDGVSIDSTNKTVSLGVVDSLPSKNEKK